MPPIICHISPLYIRLDLIKILKRIIYLQEEADIPYEEEILRHPYSVKCWMRYITHKLQTTGKNQNVNLLYERALKELPGRLVSENSIVVFTHYHVLVSVAWFSPGFCHSISIARVRGELDSPNRRLRKQREKFPSASLRKILLL